jgi:hypothetical protein
MLEINFIIKVREYVAVLLAGFQLKIPFLELSVIWYTYLEKSIIVAAIAFGSPFCCGFAATFTRYKTHP